MYRTLDSYNLYYDGIIEKTQQNTFGKLIKKHNMNSRFEALLGQHYNYTMASSYGEYKSLLWILWQTLATFAITIFFSEDDHPPGCEYQTKVDFFIDEVGNFEYEVKNNLLIHEDEIMSKTCKERIERKSVAFDKDYKVKRNIEELTLESFIKIITQGD
ncbi:MAG: hypothetical protein JSU72_09765 [Deltaproteobacteria bacterium]|nr:MAG: hypothetical protein JSU72_09765 [Deltaproteobacteria bacterium]